MRQIILILLLISPLISFPKNLSEKNITITVEDVLKQTLDKLNSLKYLDYKYKREVHYFSENYSSLLSGNLFIDLSKSNDIKNGKFIIDDEKQTVVYNSSDYFTINKKEKTINLITDFEKSGLEKISFFYNSPLTLKYCLKDVLKDNTILKTLSDTLINNRSYNSVSLLLNKRTLGYLGGFKNLSSEREIIYTIVTDKDTHVPLLILQKNSINNDYVQTTFSAIEQNIIKKPDSVFYYSSYLKNDYKLSKPHSILPTIQIGNAAQDFSLPDSQDNRLTSLDFYKGKVILLEFWINNCSYCIETVPNLNKINSRFRNKNFQLLAINSSDSKENVLFFKRKYGVDYTTLYNGKKVTKSYGVLGFPFIVLIDKRGYVIYSGLFDYNKLNNLIEKNI